MTSITITSLFLAIAVGNIKRRNRIRKARLQGTLFSLRQSAHIFSDHIKF